MRNENYVVDKKYRFTIDSGTRWLTATSSRDANDVPRYAKPNSMSTHSAQYFCTTILFLIALRRQWWRWCGSKLSLKPLLLCIFDIVCSTILHLIYVRTKQTRCAFIFFLHFLRKNKKSIWIAWALLLQLCASQSHWVHHRVLWHAQTTIEYAVSITPNGMICIVYSFWWRTGYLRVAVSLHASMHCALSKRRRTLKLPMTQKKFVHLF